MKFIRLNGKKILLRLFINLSIYSIIALIGYLIMKKNGSLLPADTPGFLLLVYGFGLFWPLIYFVAGWYSFRISRKLFTFISTLNLFDNNDYFVGYLNLFSPISYTQDCLCGRIDGYPVIVSLSLAKDKGQTTNLIFEAITVKFERTYKEPLLVELNWLRGYEPVSDVKKEVYDFIGKLKSKSSVIGTFESIIADKYLSLVGTGNNIVEN